jgi:hypothetical protein
MSMAVDISAPRPSGQKALLLAFYFRWMIVGAGMLCQLAGERDASAAPEWFLFSRHGECVEIATLKRKVPDLGEIHAPVAFVQFMRSKGYEVMVNEVLIPMGNAVEVRVPERELALMFVTASACRQMEGR